MKPIYALALLFLAPAAHAQSAVSFGSGASCTGATYISVCAGFSSDNLGYSIDSIARTNAGKLTIVINNLAYTGNVSFITDQVIQQNCCGHDGLILEHVDSLLLTARTGLTLLASLKVMHQQHPGGGINIKQHYTINTYIVQSGTVQFY